MHKHDLLIAALLYCFVAVYGCASKSNLGDKANGRECSESTIASCASGMCLTLKTNLQEKPGICTDECTTNADCLHGGQCFIDVLPFHSVCLTPCATDDDCVDGFVCIGDTKKVCLVGTSGGQSAADGGV